MSRGPPCVLRLARWLMRLLLTGASGQVGMEMTRALKQHRIFSDVVATSRAELDFTRREEVFHAVANFGPEVIVHLGAMTAVDRCEDEPDAAYLANALSVRHIKQAARLVDARVVYMSTDYVFDGLGSRPYREWDAKRPLSVYGKSKFAGEMELDPTDLVLRTSWVMGRYGNNILKTILGAAKRSSEMRFVDDQVGSPTVVSDLVEATLALLLEDQSGVYHLSNQGSLSWYELARFVYELVGADPALIAAMDSAELALTRKAPRPAYSVLDNCALRLQGYPPLAHYSESLSRLALELWSEM